MARVSAALLLSLFVLELFFRLYFYLWNTNQSVPFLLFERPFPRSEQFRSFIQKSGISGVLFELKPSISATFLDKPFYTNSDGIIGRVDFTKQKPPGTYRIAGVGDSVMSSWGVSYEETFLARLGEKLQTNMPESRVEIINFAVPGYNAAIEAQVIETKVLAYNPDLIIIHFVGNDLDLPNFIRKQVTAGSYLLYVVKKLFFREPSTTSDALGDQDYLGTEMEVAPLAWAGRFVFTKEQTPPQYQYMVGSNNYLKIMTELAKVTVQKGIPVIIFFTSEIIKTETLSASELLIPLKQMGYWVLDGDSALNNYLMREDLMLSQIQLDLDDHLNLQGHQIFANILEDYLSENKGVLQ